MIAERVKALSPSPTFAMEARARELRARGVDVISFGAGEPDFDTPDRIKQAANRAMRDGHTKYTAVAGIHELRAAVCEKLKRDNGLHYDPSQVLISCGSKHSLFNMVMTLVNPCDEVIIPSPYWVSYPEQARMVGGVPVAVPSDEATGFDIDVEKLRRAITPRTKVIILNSPNNPTGAIFSQQTLRSIAELAIEAKLWVVSDETYEALTYEGRPQSIATLGPEIKARSLIINTCSKAYAMTGWRIGYTAGPRELIQAMTDVQSQVTSNPSTLAQWAAVEALTGPQEEVGQMLSVFKARRRVIVDGLNSLPGIRCLMPKGAFYALANITGLLGRRAASGDVLRNSTDVASFFLNHAQVAVIPGIDFGIDTHVRLSYATSDSLIRRGLDRLDAAIRLLR